MKNTKNIYSFVLGTIFGLSIAIVGGYYVFPSIYLKQQFLNINVEKAIDSIKNELKASKVDDKYSKFEKVLNILQTDYYDKEKIDTEKMIENGLKGFVDALQDPYTIYMPPQESTDFQEDLKGEKDFEGIGAVVAKKENGVMIEEVLKSSPAHKAGLMPLDLIIEIDGQDTKPLSLSDAVKKIRGPKGTKVTLTIIRGNDIKKIDVIRDRIVVPSVMGKVYTITGNQNIGYINISIIGDDTPKALQNVLNDFKSQNIKGIILDLRGNGGGYLNAVPDIVSHFIPKDKLLVTARYSMLGQEQFKSYGYGTYENIPMVILVDGLTASASEIITSALKKRIGAKVIGTKTFGKGTIQTIKDIGGGASLKYTIGKWFTPDGENVDKIGITPDIIVEFDKQRFEKDQTDNQLEKAKEQFLK